MGSEIEFKLGLRWWLPEIVSAEVMEGGNSASRMNVLLSCQR
ncbi:hypothetical protein [Mucilaginibacter paludis]|uniref:Uncharacterized protein n=1 Tax=Mucilaginibacter paludis DSM 18603 TaxID=714943 RepID=H1Y4I9_9SPHI|nr:hypothetical protein [Mucilaginibacter paludis]EHQ26773.1 hypothetical protein Mucpa_2659 [Mucilaginibacter paludis DSM 18603]